MLGRTVIASLFITLLTLPSAANDKERKKALVMQECYRALAAVESQLNNQVIQKNLNEQQIDDVNLLLDEADYKCSKYNLSEGTEIIKKANEILNATTKEKLD